MNNSHSWDTDDKLSGVLVINLNIRLGGSETNTFRTFQGTLGSLKLALIQLGGLMLKYHLLDEEWSSQVWLTE
jgi:hypothetical protein